MNSFGLLFRVEIFGESHGPALGCVIDGCPVGTTLKPCDLDEDIRRRKAGPPGSTERREEDRPEILSGLYEGRTSGAPLCIVFRNHDQRPGDYADSAARWRPGHADFVGARKYRGCNDPRGAGHFSGRLTLPLVAAGVVAKKVLRGAVFSTRILEAGGSPDVEAAVTRARAEGDSVGALVELRVSGLPVGLGEPFFDSAEGLIAQAVFAVPGVKGLEFGSGFAAAGMLGSEHNDVYVDEDGRTATNRSGGVSGGISNGNELVLRAAFKPTPSIARPQTSYDPGRRSMAALSCEGRHDSCIALRGAVAVEAAAAIALADLALRAAVL